MSSPADCDVAPAAGDAPAAGESAVAAAANQQIQQQQQQQQDETAPEGTVDPRRLRVAGAPGPEPEAEKAFVGPWEEVPKTADVHPVCSCCSKPFVCPGCQKPRGKKTTTKPGLYVGDAALQD